MENIKNILFNFIQQPFLCSITSTTFLLILMQFTIPFDPMLLLLNLLLVYWAIRNRYMVME